MKRLLSGSLVLVTVLSMLTVGTVQAVPRAQEKDKILFSTLSSPTEIIDHPWATLVEEYNAANPNVEVEIIAGATWDSLGTMILAGNPPDLMHVSMAGIFGRVPQMPYAVDVAPWISEEDKADFGPLFDALRHPSNPDHILGFPVELRPEPEICANVELFEAAGIDWMKIRTEGWSWDEFIAASQLLTVDETGKHPTDADFNDDEVTTWGWGGGTTLSWAMGIAMMNNGVAQYTGPSIANVGSVWDLTGPRAAEAAQWVQDWLYKYKITDPAFRAWGDAQFMQELQFVIEGKTAMHGYGGSTCQGAVEMYNDAVDRGEVAGTKLDARLWSLPHPYNPTNMPHEVYSVRPIYLQMMRQEPYKGDEHTENVARFAQWFISTETQIRRCTELASAPSCPVPARKSVRDVVATDPQRNADIEYMVARGKVIPQLSHPALATIQTQVFNPGIDRLFSNDVTGQEFVDQVAGPAQEILDDWVNSTTVEETALVQLWCIVPSWFPGQFYPNYTPTVSAACQAKLTELDLQ